MYIEEVDQDAKAGKSVQVHIIRAGAITGSSRLVSDRGIFSSVTEMIEGARDLVYENELFFEIAREARTLANLGVRTTEDTVAIDLSDNTFVQIEMVSVEKLWIYIYTRILSFSEEERNLLTLYSKV